MSEAVYLHKPLLSVPVEGQFEQVMNALYLQKLGYGLFAQELTLERLHEFLERLPELESSLSAYRQDGNTLALAVLKEQLARASSYGRWDEMTHG